MRPSAVDRRAGFRGATAFALVAAVGCTFDDGEPWGEAHPSLAVRFDVPESRRTADGALRTANDYALTISALDLSLGSLSLGFSEDTDAPAGFDPAAPPAGFTLCHNGHCHGPGGKLFSYAEVAAVAGGGGAGGPGADAIVADVDAPDGVPLTAETRDVPLSGCPCDVPRGRLTGAAVAVTGLRVRATVRDLRATPRLASTETAVDVFIPLDTTLQAPLSARIDRDEPVTVAVDALLVVTPHVLDALDFAQPAISAEVADETGDRLRTHSTLNLEMHR